VTQATTLGKAADKVATARSGEATADDFPWPQPDLLAADVGAWLRAVLEQPGLLTRLHLNMQAAVARTLLAHLDAPIGGDAVDIDRMAALARSLHGAIAGELRRALRDADTLADSVRRRLRFVAEQAIAAANPDNNPLWNDRVRSRLAATGGRSAATGMKRLQADLLRDDGRLKLRFQRPGSFRPGRDVATTPGDVVFETRLMQLIRYRPVGASLRRRPLLIVPPFINKFYILDLTPPDSLVRWLVSQGVDVFMISWADGRTLAGDCDLGDYLAQGVEAAIDVISAQLPAARLDLMGYCVGGTLAACQAAAMAACGDDRLARLSLLTTLLDFAEPGDLGVFISTAQLERLEAHLDTCGVLSADLLQRAFTLLKPDALIWRPIIERYLEDREVQPNAMLAWSEDGCAIPARAAMTYLRRLYLENRLTTPQALVLNGQPLDLSLARLPTYAVATRSDHIAPWRSVLHGLRLLPNVERFVLADGGHVGGIIRPPGSGKGGYIVNAAGCDNFAIESTRTDGSWWPDWLRWLTRDNHRRALRGSRFSGIEPAPGRYVRGAGEAPAANIFLE